MEWATQSKEEGVARDRALCVEVAVPTVVTEARLIVLDTDFRVALLPWRRFETAGVSCARAVACAGVLLPAPAALGRVYSSPAGLASIALCLRLSGCCAVSEVSGSLEAAVGRTGADLVGNMVRGECSPLVSASIAPSTLLFSSTGTGTGSP